MAKRLVVAIGLMCVLMLAGCSAASDSSSTGSTTAPTDVATPTGGRSLADVGFTSAVAASIWLPSGTRLTYTADQPNLVIASGDIEQASMVESFLRSSLEGLGWAITADSDGGLLFTMGQWQGAFVVGDTTWALTARND